MWRAEEGMDSRLYTDTCWGAWAVTTAIVEYCMRLLVLLSPSSSPLFPLSSPLLPVSLLNDVWLYYEWNVNIVCILIAWVSVFGCERDDGWVGGWVGHLLQLKLRATRRWWKPRGGDGSESTREKERWTHCGGDWTPYTGGGEEVERQLLRGVWSYGGDRK